MILLDFSIEILVGALVALFLLNVYSRYFKTNDTEIDLIGLYCKRQMFLRYDSRKYEKT